MEINHVNLTTRKFQITTIISIKINQHQCKRFAFFYLLISFYCSHFAFDKFVKYCLTLSDIISRGDTLRVYINFSVSSFGIFRIVMLILFLFMLIFIVTLLESVSFPSLLQNREVNRKLVTIE